MRGTIVLLISMLALGCSGGDELKQQADNAKSKTADQVMAELKTIVDRACACKDRACAEKATDDFVAMLRANRYVQGGDEQKANALGQRFGQCAVAAGIPTQTFIDRLNKASN
jgi:hypothetical protein